MIIKPCEKIDIKVGNANSILYHSTPIDEFKVKVEIEHEVLKEYGFTLVLTFYIDTYTTIDYQKIAECTGECRSEIINDGTTVPKDIDVLLTHIKTCLLRTSNIAGGNNTEFSTKALLAAKFPEICDKIAIDLIENDFWSNM